MATPTSLGADVVDNVTTILAAHVNNLRAWASYTAPLGLNSNTETLAAAMTLTDADEPVQFLDPGGAARAIELPAEATTNHPFYICNTADAAETLTVSDDGANEIGAVAQGETKLFVSDGTSWTVLSGGGGITVAEEDGTPSVSDVETIKFTNGTVMDNGDGSVSVTTGGGGAGTVLPSTEDGRLTLETGVPVSSTDQTAKATLYYTPFIGNQIALYDGTSAWELIEFSEISISLAGYTVNKNYDIFIYNNAGTASLESAIWTNDTTRATALAYQDGVLSKTGALTRRYVGTIRITGTAGQCEDSETKRYVFSNKNRVNRPLFKSLSATHTYNATALRIWNNDADAKVDFVVGVLSTLSIIVAGIVKAGAAAGNAYIGASTDGSTLDTAIGYFLNSNTNYVAGAGVGAKQFSPGFATVSCLESGDATNAASFTQMQIKGIFEG